MQNELRAIYNHEIFEFEDHQIILLIFQQLADQGASKIQNL